MTLKADYLNGSTGLQTQLDNAFAAGQTLVSANLTTFTSQLQSNAAAGNTTFTITLPTSFQPAFLRQNGLLLKAYLAGCQDGMAQQQIYNYECTPVLDTSDQLTTSIDFNFTFQAV